MKYKKSLLGVQNPAIRTSLRHCYCKHSRVVGPGDEGEAAAGEVLWYQQHVC